MIDAPAPVRVAFVVDSDTMGGAEQYVVLLLRGLPDRFDGTLVATDVIPPRFLDAVAATGTPVTLVPRIRHKADTRRLAAWRDVLEAARPGLIHVNQSVATNNRHAVLVAATLREPAVVTTLHLPGAIPTPLQARLLRPAFRRVDAAIGVSRPAVAELRDALGVRPDRVHLVANGVPVTPSHRRPPTHPVRIAALGRLDRSKGFDVLIDAVHRLVAWGDAVEVVIGGSGPERGCLASAAHGMPVRLVGFVDDPVGLLAGCDVFCLPSRTEGLPLALLEAMMAGLPCVATDVGDVRAAAGDVVVVVPPDDPDALAGALHALVTTPERRQVLGDAGHEAAVRRFSLPAMVDATAAVYDTALATRRRIR